MMDDTTPQSPFGKFASIMLRAKPSSVGDSPVSQQAESLFKAVADHPGSAMTALTLTVGTLVGWLPSIAAFLAVLWYLIQMWDSPWGLRQRARVSRWLYRKAAHQPEPPPRSTVPSALSDPPKPVDPPSS